jgi:hypothetical protein
MPASLSHDNMNRRRQKKELAAKINCDQFEAAANGMWIAKPNAVIGNPRFGGNIFGRGTIIDKADLAVVLDQKCRGRI